MPLAAVGGLALLTGCPEKATEPPSPGVVPLRVWVILSDRDSDLGDDQNVGCRLSQVEITSYIQALRTNTPALFGTNDPFTWTGNVQKIYVTEDLLPGQRGQPREVVDAAYLMAWLFLVEGKWAPNHLNIYFAGHLDPGTAYALTVDPNPNPNVAFIAINDRGLFAPSGHAVVLADHVLEHEMGHFLLRRTGQSPYDENEHVEEGSYNIMERYSPFPLVLPSAEQQEAKTRLEGTGWRLP
ncbi:MAG TPA: hypothetical protein VM243_15375 [Phycisphaerae bacterium]|nr:hypothetical protein [Phycisphaerae bacterium]